MAEAAIMELKDALAATYPEIFPGQDPTVKRKMSRLQAAPGDHSSNPKYDSAKDPHVAGLALDIILLAWVERERKLAENLVDLFIYHKAAMGWNAVIYNHVTTDDLGGPKPHPGSDPHTSHIHIQWPRSRAGTTGFIGAMQADLTNLHDLWANHKPLPNE